MSFRAACCVGLIAIIASVTGCANPQAEDWHRFQADTTPMQQQLQKVISAWQQLDTSSGSLKPPQKYLVTVVALDKSILPALKSALISLDKAHPKTTEVQNLQTRYGEALARLELSAREMRTANASLQAGKTRDGSNRLADSKEELRRALAALKEAEGQKVQFNERYGSATP